jgi:hypothetical protein
MPVFLILYLAFARDFLFRVMQKLNLPEFEYTLRKADGKVWIFDVIRKKYLVLTPEEWVRQHFIHYAINVLQYPKTLIKVEGGLKYNTLAKRSDVLIFDRHGNPWMLVECKSTDVQITDSSLRQVSAYNATLKAPFLSVTNGLRHYCCTVNWKDKKIDLIQDFPSYPKATDEGN